MHAVLPRSSLKNEVQCIFCNHFTDEESKSPEVLQESNVYSVYLCSTTAKSLNHLQTEVLAETGVSTVGTEEDRRGVGCCKRQILYNSNYEWTTTDLATAEQG